MGAAILLTGTGSEWFDDGQLSRVPSILGLDQGKRLPFSKIWDQSYDDYANISTMYHQNISYGKLYNFTFDLCGESALDLRTASVIFFIFIVVRLKLCLQSSFLSPVTEQLPSASSTVIRLRDFT